MTVATTSNRKTYAGDNVSTSFATSPVVFFDTSDLAIQVVNNTTGVSTLLVENTDYTVTGGAGAVGTVNLAGGSAPHGALISGTTLVILRVLPITQTTDFVNGDNSDAEVAETALDRLTMVAQQLQETLDRAITLPSGDVSGSTNEFVSAASRAGLLLGFDASGLLTYYVPQIATPNSIVTATVKVVTPLVQAAPGQALSLASNGSSVTWQIGTGGSLVPASDNTVTLGGLGNRIATAFTPVIDSGTTGSLSLKTNNGTTQARIDNVASAVNFPVLRGHTTGLPAQFYSDGETNVGIDYIAKGAADHRFIANGSGGPGSGAVQFAILNASGATRNITVTGSNGGNPTISTTAGSLAITPSVVIAGASLQVGTNPSSLGALNVPYNNTFSSRNSANSADRSLIFLGTINSVVDVIQLGDANLNGVYCKGRSGGAAPTVGTDLPPGFWTVWRDTGGATTKLYYNNAGTLQSVALA